MGSMDTRPSGGSEPAIRMDVDVGDAVAETLKSKSNPAQPQNENEKAKVPGNGIPKGKGRIIRDVDGNVVDIEFGEPHEEGDAESGEGEEGEVALPWGKPMEDWGGGIARVEPKTEVVRELERLSANVVKAPRVASMHEVAWLRSLVALHGTEIEAMARDRKNNVWQKTVGELRKAISKAGGFEKLRA